LLGPKLHPAGVQRRGRHKAIADNFVQGFSEVAFRGFDVVGAADILELVVVPDDIVVQAVPVFVDFETDRSIGGDPCDLHGMADNGLVVDLRNFDKVFDIGLVELDKIEISIAGGFAEFSSEFVRAFGLCDRVLHGYSSFCWIYRFHHLECQIKMLFFVRLAQKLREMVIIYTNIVMADSIRHLSAMGLCCILSRSFATALAMRGFLSFYLYTRKI